MIIKFNLVPIHEEAKEEKRILKTNYLFFLFVSIFLVIVGIAGSAIYLIHKEQYYEKIKKIKIAQLQKYKDIAKKVKLLKKQNEEIRQKILTILSLKRKQGKYLQIYDILVSSIGDNKILFKNLKIQPGKAYLQAIALDLEEVANYLRGLELHNKVLKSVELRNTYKKKMGNIALVEFNTEIRF